MLSISHQWLLLWVARKMVSDGFVVAGYEGPTPQGGYWNDLPVPFGIAGVRPDAWGFTPDTGEIAIGEAKTAGDLVKAHTRKQFGIFGELIQRQEGRFCRFYIAVPRSAAQALERTLADSSLIGRKHVVRLLIPDCMVPEAAV